MYSVATEQKAENPLIVSHVPLKWVKTNTLKKCLSHVNPSMRPILNACIRISFILKLCFCCGLVKLKTTVSVPLLKMD